MKLLKDWEYFHDIDKNGKLKKESDGLSLGGAAGKFLCTVFEESSRDASFEVSTTYSYGRDQYYNYWSNERIAEQKAEKSIERKIHRMEQSVFYECVKNFMKEDPNRIGDFPDAEYHLHTLRSEKDKGRTLEVKLRCSQLIQEYRNSLIEMLGTRKDELKKEDRQRRNLRLAAWLAVIHFLLNVATTLSFWPEYSFLYFGSANPEMWGCFVGAILLVARLCHFSKTSWHGIGIFLVAGTGAIQMISPEMRLEAFHGGSLISFFCFCCIVTLTSLIGVILFIKDACKAPRSEEGWSSWIAKVDSNAIITHKEIRFLMLWYQHMTGQTCYSLSDQEKQLYKFVSLANKKRAK